MGPGHSEDIMALHSHKHECPGAEPRSWCFSKAKLPAERMTLCTDHRYRCRPCAERFECYQAPDPDRAS